MSGRRVLKRRSFGNKLSPGNRAGSGGAEEVMTVSRGTLARIVEKQARSSITRCPERNASRYGLRARAPRSARRRPPASGLPPERGRERCGRPRRPSASGEPSQARAPARSEPTHQSAEPRRFKSPPRNRNVDAELALEKLTPLFSFPGHSWARRLRPSHPALRATAASRSRHCRRLATLLGASTWSRPSSPSTATNVGSAGSMNAASGRAPSSMTASAQAELSRRQVEVE